MLALDALNYRHDGAVWRRVEVVRADLSIDATAATIMREFNLTCSHRTVVRWITNGEEANRNARAARAHGRNKRREKAS